VEMLARLPAQGLSLEHLDACPVCAAASFRKVFEHVDKPLPLRLHQCEQCDLVFLNPRLTEASIKEVEEVNTYYSYTPEVLHEEVTKRIALIRSFERYKKPPGRMIDIGCNRGLLMAAARSAGWEPFGIDISSTAVEHIRRDFGLEAYCGLLDTFVNARPFDLCVAWHVLEHTTSPGMFAAHLLRLLAPNGVLALQVPCYSRLREFAAENRLYSLVNKVHNFHFTSATLGKLLTTAGFQILELIEGPDHMLTAFARKP
jgi:2-polyprenyl-3-methyl-5-hydroxy-6-metoxy-1,4-benzoquinol methylase